MAYLWKPNIYFTPTAYVAVSGNDLNAGTADAPYRTLQKCKDAGKLLIQIGSGVYRELPTFAGTNTSLFGDGIVEVNGFSISGVFSTNQLGFYNIRISNMSPGQFLRNHINSVMTRLTFAYVYNQGILTPAKSVFKYCTIGQLNNGSAINLNCTFINCTVTINDNSYFNLQINHIFYNCSIYISVDSFINYHLFYNCTFRIGADATYTALIGVDDAAKLANLRSRYAARFPLSTNTFLGCSVSDPLFNDYANGDYTLSPLSPARHLAYDGTFVGAFDVAYKIIPKASDLATPNSFYNASKGTNILASDLKLSLLRNPDGSSAGSGAITTKPLDFSFVHELRTIIANQQIADRNREWIDTHTDIDMSLPIYPGTAIVVGETYVVEGGSITYNSVVYTTRSKFIAVTGQTAFTSSDGAYLFQITELPMRSTCEMRFKSTISGTVINAGTNLTANSWYKVVNNTIYWNSLVVPVGDYFQAIAGQLSFTGSGGCVEYFNDSDLWYEFEIGEKPTAKRLGNVNSNAIDTGIDGQPLTNGHKEFYTSANKARASLVIYARYIQYRLNFQNTMLK